MKEEIFEVLHLDKWITVDNSFKEIKKRKTLKEARVASDKWIYFVSTQEEIFFIYRLKKHKTIKDN